MTCLVEYYPRYLSDPSTLLAQSWSFETGVSMRSTIAPRPPQLIPEPVLEVQSTSSDSALPKLRACCRNRELPGGSESDKFQADPLAFLESTYALADPEHHKAKEECVSTATAMPPPDLAVMYDTHLERPGVAEFLRDRLGLESAEKHFNAHVNGDADSDDTYKSVHVLERMHEPRLHDVDNW